MRFSRVSDVERLIRSQSGSWPLLARGMKGLQESRTRALEVWGRELMVRHIPHRITSTTAPVDAASIAKRPCFLCRENLPPEEIGIAMDEEFTAYCNPFPILAKHLTIVHREHRPQAIAGMVGEALALAEALPGFFVIYNGPRCGASAPDHLHFQACSRELFPIERDARERGPGTLQVPGRRVFCLRGTDSERLAEQAERLIEVLAEVTGTNEEPMLNIAVFHDPDDASGARDSDGADAWTLFVFPRAKHRPRVYETGELTVSPAAIDLSGVFVLPLAGDFDRITAADVESIFDEVSLAKDLFDTVLKRLEAAS